MSIARMFRSVSAVALLIVTLAAPVEVNAAAERGVFVQAAVYSGPCLDGTVSAFELVDLSGNAHFVVARTTDATGIEHYVAHASMNLTGLGETTGDAYRYVSSFTDAHPIIATNGIMRVVTTVSTGVLIRPGSGDNFRGKSVTHLTLDAAGQVVSAKFDVTRTCVG